MVLNIILDVILIAIIAGGSRYGYNKGLFKMAEKPARLLLCMALSFALSGIVGSQFVAPIILSQIDSIPEALFPAVNAVSSTLAFALLFYFFKIIISFILSLVSRIFDEGLIGMINRALGFALAGVIALLIAMCFASLTDYLIMQGLLSDFQLISDFSGGPLYKLLVFLSPLRMIFTPNVKL